MRDFLVTALQTTARVLEAEDGDRAVEFLEQCAGRGIDLLLLDYLLPKRSGLEILRLAKERWSWIPVVIITGAGSEELAIEALRAGARDYLKKPVDLKELTQTIRFLATLDRRSGATRRHVVVDHPADPSRPYSPLHPAMYRAVAFVGEHFTEAMSLEEVASMAALSKFHFCRVFRRETGLSFRDYLRDLRIARAKALLANPKLTVTEIAYTVGFNDLSHFHRVFSKVVGASPTNYRKSLQPPLA